MEGMSCSICGNRIVIKGISLVCTGCGNATRSNHIFSTEQDFQKNTIKRTTQHIKQRQDKYIQIHQTLQGHLKQNWLQYLFAFSKYIIHLGIQLNLDVKPLYQKYLEQFTNQPINSNWTVARKGHQGFSKNRTINSKYKKLKLNDSVTQVKIEEDIELDFEKPLSQNFRTDQQEQNSIIEILQTRKKISKQKNPFYERRQLKYKLTHKQKENLSSKRKQSSNRKGSHIMDVPILSDKIEFIKQVLSTLTLTNTLYLALIELYFERFYLQDNSIDSAIKKIKNIVSQNRDHSKWIAIKIIKQEQFQRMSSFVQMEFIFLQDIMCQMTDIQQSFPQLYDKWKKVCEEILQSQMKKRNIQFISRKLKKLSEYLEINANECSTQETDLTVHINNQLFYSKKDLLPLDFTFGLVLIYATNLINNNNIYPSKLIQQIKQKKLLFLEGFSKYLNGKSNQYLTVPQHIPKPYFIRDQSIKLLKKLNILYIHQNKEQMFQIFKEICFELNISKKLFDIAMSLEAKYFREYHVDNSQYDIYSCSLLLLAFKYYLAINKPEALYNLAQISKYEKHIQPYDFKDLQDGDIDDIKQSLEKQVKLDYYYGNRYINEKLTQKLQQVDNFFETQIVQEQHQQYQYSIETKNDIKIEIIHEDWNFYKSQEFDWEAPEVRYLEMKLTDYLDEEENVIILQFHEMEKYIA